MICGQPMGIKIAGTGKQQQQGDLRQTEYGNKLDGIGNHEDSLLLTTTCPIRLVMIGHNVLGTRQNCHLVDRYTFLEKNIVGASFKEQFRKYKDSILEISPVFSTFEEDIQRVQTSSLHVTVYDEAAATCKRIADSTTISGCALCNKAMDRDIMHINATYRCFGPTKDANIAKLEANTKDSIAIKKVVQQIALYFVPTSTVWKAKSGEKLMLDGALWRCIAHLCAWGLSKQFRFRLIAIFHAAHYIYLTSRVNGSIEFEDWHLHLFRDFYIKTFHNSNSWFGLSLGEVSSMFNLSQKWGDQWLNLVKGRLETIGGNMDSIYEFKPLYKISQFQDEITKYVSNERTLINFVCSKNKKVDHKQVQQGLDRLLYFFKYNISSPGEIILLNNCKLFEIEMCKVYQKLYHRPNF
jgi:hypothetical protein